MTHNECSNYLCLMANTASILQAVMTIFVCACGCVYILVCMQKLFLQKRNEKTIAFSCRETR